MNDYVIVCIGTNKIVSDSFGPRVGEKLKMGLKNIPKIQVFGTLENPIHFKNAPQLVKKLKIQNGKIILVDSAISECARVGSTFISYGGIEIGKAYGKSFYFPAMFNLKTVIGNKNNMPMWQTFQIETLANNVAEKLMNLFKVL